MAERIVAEALSGYGCVRIVISLSDATIDVERWHGGPHVKASGTLESDTIEALRTLAMAVSQDEQALVRGCFYADGEERLSVELDGHVVRLHNESDRIRTPGATPLLRRCYELGDLLPR